MTTRLLRKTTRAVVCVPTAIYHSALMLSIVLILNSIFSNVADAQSNLPVNLNSALGINTNEAVEINSSLPFVDLFRYSLPFDEARPWFTKGAIKYDKFGWPENLNGGQAGTRFLSHIPAAALSGDLYTVKYEGEGQIRYGGSAKLVKHEPGKDLIRLDPMPDGKITATLIIEKSNPKNYIRNISVLMPGGICVGKPLRTVKSERSCPRDQYRSFADHHQWIIFNPDYLNFMKDFKVIRFMNMAGITRNNIRSWKDRAVPQKATWGGKEGVRGVPLEIMVTLANRLDINPWFNIPHNADYNYILNFARFIKQNLKPNLKVYLEYSNETWNNVFVPQAEHMKQTGYKEGLDKNRDIAGTKYYAKQSVQIFKIWEKEFGGTDRLIRVLGGMTTDLKLTHTLLGFQNTYKYVDALAIAPYFHIAQDKMPTIKSANAVFNALAEKDNRYSAKNILEFVKQQADLAREYGVDLIAYEGGQHLVDHKTHSMKEGATPYLYAANKDPRMAQAYYHFLKGWKKSGGNLFVAFSAPRPATWHGSWGVKEYISENILKAPKYRALLAFNRGEPCWWKNCATGKVVRLEKPRRIPGSLISGTSSKQGKASSVKVFKHNAPQHTLHNATAQNISRLINGTISDNRDLSGRWRASWDDDKLLLWINVIDEKTIQDSNQVWADDSIELYIDTDNSKTEAYDGKNDYSISFRLDDGKPPEPSSSSPPIKTMDVKHHLQKTPLGYQYSINIPWKILNFIPEDGKRIGFDIQINDDDTGGGRDAKVAWNSSTDQAWKSPQFFGELLLVDSSAQTLNNKKPENLSGYRPQTASNESIKR